MENNKNNYRKPIAKDKNLNKKHSRKKVSIEEKLKIEKNLLEVENQSFKLQIENQKNKIKELEDEIIKRDLTLVSKANELSEKAKQEIEKHKSQSNEKLEEEKNNLKKYGIQKFFEEFLNPLNNLDLAIQSGNNIDNSVVKNYVVGFQMLFNQMQQVLEDFGIQKIEPKIGDEFNSELHQVFELVEGKETNKIVSVKNVGYKLHDRVIKPALVIVGK